MFLSNHCPSANAQLSELSPCRSVKSGYSLKCIVLYFIVFIGAFISIFSNRLKAPHGDESFEACCQWALLHVQIITLLFPFTVQKYIYPCVRYYACAYTRGWSTPTTSQHTILTRKNSHHFLVCSGRDSNLCSLYPLDLEADALSLEPPRPHFLSLTARGLGLNTYYYPTLQTTEHFFDAGKMGNNNRDLLDTHFRKYTLTKKKRYSKHLRCLGEGEGRRRGSSTRYT